MTPDQWTSVEARFAELSKLPEAARAAALAAIDDAEVRAELASLLQHSGAGDTVAGIIAGAAERVESEAIREQRIGPYRLVRRLGQGGQGAVFEALRDDGTFHQRVAIKIVKWEIDSDIARTQFRHERQILAGLEHPHIARLLDGGETAEGTPYLVMEYVDGAPLTTAAKDWPVKKKLQLFLEVAAAVAYAHRNLIVHRDLKPANILVTADGAPKLLDFGIAKLLDNDGQRTQTLLQAMTPDYASPEQVRGQPITTASDVYSLGVILYQLLTGRAPYKLENTSPGELDRVICHAPPAAPALGDELDHILLMALRKEPERRYTSVQSFAEDIERYLDNRPVSAQPDTFRYRAGKFLRRNRLAVVAVTLVIASLGAGLGFSIAAQRRADRRFQQVRQLANRFLFDFNNEIANKPGMLKAREMIVSTALEYLNSLSADAAGDPGLQWELAVAYSKVALVQHSGATPSLHRPKDAIASLEQALSLARPLADRNLLDARQREAFTGILCDAEARHRQQGELEPAVRIGREAVARSVALSLPAHGRAMNELAITLSASGDLKGGVEVLESMLPIARQALAKSTVLENRQRVASTLINLGLARAKLTRFADAQASITESLAAYRALAADHPGDTRFSRRIFLALNHLGDIAGAGDRPSLGDPSRAAVHYEAALAVLEPLMAADANDKGTRGEAGLVHDRLAYALRDTEPRKALAHARLAAEALDASDSRPEYRAQARIAAADCQRALGQFPDAERLLRQAEALLMARENDTGFDLILSWARLQAAQGNRDAAAHRFQQAIALGDRLLQKSQTPDYAWAQARALEIAAEAIPAEVPGYRKRVLDLWLEQNQRFPGLPYMEQQVVRARTLLKSPSAR